MLRGIVILLGVLIVAVLAVMAVFAVQKFAHKPEAAAPAAFNLVLEEGHAIRDYTLDGDRLAVRIQTDDGETIAIVDVKRGQILGTVSVKPAP